jgi:hypothetical protein
VWYRHWIEVGVGIADGCVGGASHALAQDLDLTVGKHRYGPAVGNGETTAAGKGSHRLAEPGLAGCEPVREDHHVVEPCDCSSWLDVRPG